MYRINMGELDTILDQLPKPYILVVNFNAKNPLYEEETVQIQKADQ